MQRGNFRKYIDARRWRSRNKFRIRSIDKKLDIRSGSSILLSALLVRIYVLPSLNGVTALRCNFHRCTEQSAARTFYLRCLCPSLAPHDNSVVIWYRKRRARLLAKARGRSDVPDGRELTSAGWSKLIGNGGRPDLRMFVILVTSAADADTEVLRSPGLAANDRRTVKRSLSLREMELMNPRMGAVRPYILCRD